MWILLNLTVCTNIVPATLSVTAVSKEDKYNFKLTLEIQSLHLVCFIRVNVSLNIQMTPIEAAAERRHMDIVDYLSGCGMSDVSI